MAANNILLESGTNELEILEFSVGNLTLGINVIKVKEILRVMPVTKIPETKPYLEGLLNLREENLPLIDLISYLEFPAEQKNEEDKVIVTEFNQFKAGFRVNNVARIHRISWDQLYKPPGFVSSEESCIIGIIKLDEGRIVQLLDFEKILFDIDSRLGDMSHEVAEKENTVSDKFILFVDDSPTLQKIMEDFLPKAGYPNFKIFENGIQAWEYIKNMIEKNGTDVFEEISLIITDIEMPQMDGHHLTKKIKEHQILKNLPVIIFSSLITEDLRHKGESVGADFQVSKPNYSELAHIIEQLIAQ